MRQIVVNTESMRSAHKVCNSQVESLSTLLKEMYMSVETLNATWEGTNHDDFESIFKARYAAMEQLVAAIEEYLQRLDSACDSYETCDAEVFGLASF